MTTHVIYTERSEPENMDYFSQRFFRNHNRKGTKRTSVEK